MASRQRRRSGGRPRGDRDTEQRKPAPAVRELDPVADAPEFESFEVFDLGPEVQSVIAGMGIEVPTPIQALAIPPVLDGRDVIAKAETGTGKTLAFGAPMIARIDPGRASVLALVLCPTRELAQQVHDVLAVLGATRGVRTALVIGGDPMHPQVDAIQAGAQVVVGTPGRVMDLMRQGFLSFPWTEYAVLDEADEMLEIGFIDDIREIFRFLPEERQTLCFSATFPPELLKLAREHTRDPVEIATARGIATVRNIRQTWIDLRGEDRPLALLRLMEGSQPEDVFLVFCDRRTDVDRLMRRLERTAWPIKALHGGFDQAARFRVMTAFRAGEVKMLVATDVASRGLDITHVTAVVNFSIPKEITAYTHRIGRTGRAGREGRSISLVSEEDRRRWALLVKNMNWDVEEIPFPPRPRRALAPAAPIIPGLEPSAAGDPTPAALPTDSRSNGAVPGADANQESEPSAAPAKRGGRRGGGVRIDREPAHSSTHGDAFGAGLEPPRRSGAPNRTEGGTETDGGADGRPRRGGRGRRRRGSGSDEDAPLAAEREHGAPACEPAAEPELPGDGFGAGLY